MTTITEILAEAFNRVKSEHGVTLSRVEYVDTGGLLGLNFKAASTAKSYGLWQSPIPPLGGQIPVTPPAERPKDATHMGSIDGGPNVYWRYDGMVLYWDSLGSWMRLEALSDTPHCQLVDQLTPVNPT